MTPAVTTPSALEANLACLAGRNRDVHDGLRGCRPHPRASMAPTDQGVPCLLLEGVPLCSRHRPLDEADKLVDSIDLVRSAVVVVMGFGAGWHVQRLAERLDRAGIIVVFEPDLELLRFALESVDHSAWLRRASIVFVSDPADRGTLAGKLAGAESVIAQGVAFLEHPASRRRLGTRAARFSGLFSELVAAGKTTLLTTLMRTPDTVRNLLLNLDHYAQSPGVSGLAGAAAGYPAVVVSAGPSLARNLALLSAPGVRERAVIVAAQTTLRPLLAAGTRPHFVTALDYHEISARFYEDLEAAHVHDVTLIAEPKVHPVVLDAWPGMLRCCANEFLDRVLGETAAPQAILPPGATVAHLALYVARHLGCDPIILIGQDLAFTDGLYYAPGTAIDDVWAPELNPFNTIEMMQWQRIARHRRHLSERTGVDGRPLHTDAQMLTYLQQFERDFADYARAGATVIDATEGGLPKQHTIRMPLAEALGRHATRPLPALPRAEPREPSRAQTARERVRHVRSEVDLLRRTSRETTDLLRRMLADLGDPQRMTRHFKRLDQYRAVVEEHFAAFEIINHINQLGVWKRFRADRRLHMRAELAGQERQRAQLERDLENVEWTAEASGELVGLLDEQATRRRSDGATKGKSKTVAALVAIDPRANGLGIARDLGTPFGESRSVLQATLERLGEAESIDSIVVIAPGDFDVEALIDRARIGRPVHVEPCAGSPFGARHAVIAAARKWSPTCWRGGIAGMSIYDEVLCPASMLNVMRTHGVDAALIAGPDWPLIDPALCDAVVARYHELPEQHHLVFTQAPPGFAGCLVDRQLMEELALDNRLATIGGLLVYQPHIPQHDPVARSLNVQIDHRVRRSRVRATYDAQRYRRAMDEAVRDHGTLEAITTLEACAAATPRHVVLDPWTARAHGEAFLTPGDVAVTLAGPDDPLLHPDFAAIVGGLKAAGALGVHVRTPLLAGEAALERLLASPVEVVSVDLRSGDDAARQVAAMSYLVERRPHRADHAPAAALALPWIVPRLARSRDTLEQIDAFYDRWQAALGTAVIDPAPASGGDTLLPAVTPPRAALDEARHTLVLP